MHWIRLRDGVPDGARVLKDLVIVAADERFVAEKVNLVKVRLGEIIKTIPAKEVVFSVVRE